MADKRSYTAGRYSLEVDNYNVGFMKKFSGLAMTADIVEHQLATDNVIKKNVANIAWSTGKVSVGIGMGLGMYNWIKAAFDKGVQTRHGILRAGNFDYKCESQMEFYEALITSVTIPTMDGSSKESAYFDIEFQPERVRWTPGDGGDIKGQVGTKQKAWLCANFAIEIGNLPCHRVAKIDTFTWKCSVAPDQIGLTREPTYHAAKVTVPDLNLSISNADKEPWQKAAKKWFVDGAHLEQDEMSGRILFLGPQMDVNKPIGEIELQNVGFKKFAGQDLESNSEKIDRFDVTLYVEKMKFKINDYDA